MVYGSWEYRLCGRLQVQTAILVCVCSVVDSAKGLDEVEYKLAMGVMINKYTVSHITCLIALKQLFHSYAACHEHTAPQI